MCGRYRPRHEGGDGQRVTSARSRRSYRGKLFPAVAMLVALDPQGKDGFNGIAFVSATAYTCRTDAETSDLKCDMGLVFHGDPTNPTAAPGCCQRPAAVPEAEAQIMDFLLRDPEGNCAVLGTCDLASAIGFPGDSSNYDPIRAPSDNDLPERVDFTGTRVEVSLYIIKIGVPNTLTKQLPIELLFKMAWNDMRLRWDPQNYSDISSTGKMPNGVPRVSHEPSSAIWTPDFYFPRLSFVSGNELVEVESDGDVYWVQHFEAGTNLRCRENLLWFPFDSVVCYSVLHSFGNVKQAVQFHAGHLTNADGSQGALAFQGAFSGDDSAVGPFQITHSYFFDAWVEDRVADWRTNPNRPEGRYQNLPGVVFAFQLHRTIFQSFIGIIMQPLLATELSIVALFIDPSVVPAIAGAITVILLVQFNTITAINSKIPPRERLTLLDWWLLFAIMTSVLNLTEFAVLNWCTTQLRNEAASITSAAARTPAEVFYHGMAGVGVDLADVKRAVRKIKTQRQWVSCLKEFSEKFPHFSGGDLALALCVELRTSDITRCQRDLEAKGIDASLLSDAIKNRGIIAQALGRMPTEREMLEAKYAREAAIEAGESAVAHEIMEAVIETENTINGDEAFDLWHGLCLEAANDDIARSDLEKLDFEDLASLADFYAKQQKHTSLEMFRHEAHAARVCLKRQFLEVKRLAELRSYAITESQLTRKGGGGGELPTIKLFGLVTFTDATPRRINGNYRYFAAICFNVVTLAYILCAIILPPNDKISDFCGGGNSGCCPMNDPQCKIT